MWELYDGILLWARALNETIQTGEDPSNGLQVTHRMWNYQFQGINGTFAIDANGDRHCSYALSDLSPSTGLFQVNFRTINNQIYIYNMRWIINIIRTE